MKAWDAAASLVLPDLNDCPWPMARSRLVLAAREFYTRSLAWRHEVEPFDTQPEVAEYDVVDLAGVEVVKLLEAWFGEHALEPLSADRIVEERAGLRHSGTPDMIALAGCTVTLMPTPGDNVMPVRLSVALRPPLDAAGLSDALWAQHIETIAQGAKALLFAAQGKPYSDPSAASKARFEFDAGISREYWRTTKARSRGRGRVRMHPF